MTKLSMSFAAAAVMAGVALAGAPAHAVTVVPISTGPFSVPANPSGVIPKGTLLSGTGKWDFTFTTISNTYDVLMQMQMTRVSTGVPTDIAFNLYCGAPGSGSFISHSGGTPTAASLLETLTTGDYYMQVSLGSSPVQLLTGGITVMNIPEPATWGMMILGIAGVGALIRRRRNLAAV